MALQDSIDKLKSVAGDAKELFNALKVLADQDGNATSTQQSKLTSLADKLDQSARAASKERRSAEIEQLNEIIEAHDVTLSVPGLSQGVREAVRADRVARVARRGRLRAQAATDFGGILTKLEVEKLEELVKKAKKEVQQKQKAAAFLQTAVNIADISLRIAGKLAM